MQFSVSESDPGEPEPEGDNIDFSSPEDVLILCTLLDESKAGSTNWNDYSLELCTVIGGVDGVMGVVSYEMAYYGLFEYTLQGFLEPPGDGWFVVESVTGYFSKGDGWTTDDDTEFYPGIVRPATNDEIAKA